MQILAHRGFWQIKEHQNSLRSFQLSFARGWGLETDIRDQHGQIVISHDLPSDTPPRLDELIEMYKLYPDCAALALNVKSDGLQQHVSKLVAHLDPLRYFVFDMSVPDMVVYQKYGVSFYTRQSELEKDPILYGDAVGVWMDMFYSDWIVQQDVERHLEQGKCVCLVSPELHKRDHKSFWNAMKGWSFVHDRKLLICTDFPSEATEFFQK